MDLARDTRRSLRARRSVVEVGPFYSRLERCAVQYCVPAPSFLTAIHRLVGGGCFTCWLICTGHSSSSAGLLLGSFSHSPSIAPSCSSSKCLPPSIHPLFSCLFLSLARAHHPRSPRTSRAGGKQASRSGQSARGCLFIIARAWLYPTAITRQMLLNRRHDTRRPRASSPRF